MARRKPIKLLAGAAALPLIALIAAGCGGGSSAATAAAPPKTSSGTPATVGVAKTSLGSVLVDTTGRTLYLFRGDVGTKSACTGACAAAWPPLHAHGKPTVGGGARASLISTAKRSDGTEQVTYNGHPLYLFVMDRKAGQTTGQGSTAFGAPWYVLSPAGDQITNRLSSTSGGGSGGSAASGY